MSVSDYCAFFKRVTAHDPYPYQVRVAEALLAGKNVILRAPTGAGKTLAVSVPYLYAKRKGRGLGDKMIYSVPLRTLTLGIHSQIKALFSTDDPRPKFQGIVYHNGSHSVDPFFQYEEIITTIDQTLAAYLGASYGTAKRQRNVTRGALVGAYLVFDEFHLFDVDKLCYTTVEMLTRLSSCVRFVIMSATISDGAIRELRKNLGNVVVIDLSADELVKMNRGREKYIECRPYPLDSDEILSCKGRVIVICNTVDRAQDMWRALDRRNRAARRIILLHSRFTASDRADKERELLQVFGNEGTADSDAILVATQTIEVGLDITCDHMFTDLAPLNALVQRFGRCARFKNQRGHIYVHETLDSDGERYIRPYRNRELIERTWAELRAIRSLTPNAEMALILDVFNAHDAELFQGMFQRMRTDRYDFETEILFSNSRHSVNDYVRKIISSNVAVVREDHYRDYRETITIAPYILQAKLKKLAGGRMGYIREYDKDTNAYNYTPLDDPKQLDKFLHHIILFDRIASYNRHIGFIVDATPNNGTSPPAGYNSNDPIRRGYPCESFQRHCVETYNYARGVLAGKTVAMERLSRRYHLPPAELARVVAYITKFHDLGKLNIAWQAHIQTVQARNDPQNEIHTQNKYLAHATYDSDKHAYRRSKVGHSYEGGFMAFLIFRERFREDLAVIMAYTVIKHHSSNEGINTQYISDITIPDDVGQIYAQLDIQDVDLGCAFRAAKVCEGEGTVRRRKYIPLFTELEEYLHRNRVAYFPLIIFLRYVLVISDIHATDYYDLN